VPGVTRAAVIRDPAITAGIGAWAAIQSVAPSLGVDVVPVNVRDPGEIERALTAFTRAGNGGFRCIRCISWDRKRAIERAPAWWIDQRERSVFATSRS
jgi:hypothetical protein